MTEWAHCCNACVYGCFAPRNGACDRQGRVVAQQCSMAESGHTLANKNLVSTLHYPLFSLPMTKPR